MSDVSDLSPVINTERRLFDQVYTRLHSAIVTGFFEPGARLVERDLTERLGVSRTPIREALKRLEQDGLILCFPHRGYYIRRPSFDEARQAYEVRRAMEGLAGELAAERATAEELTGLREAVRKGQDALRTGDRAALLLHNNDVHARIARAAHNAFLEQQFRAVWAYVDLLRGRWWGQTVRPDVGHGEHAAIVEAIARRDAAQARKLTEEHVARAWSNITRRFNEGTRSGAR